MTTAPLRPSRPAIVSPWRQSLSAARATTPWSHGLFYLLFWAYRGFEVDMFYRFQGVLFGTTPTFLVVAKKVLFDQLVYTLMWTTPTITMLFHWKAHHFAWEHLAPS